MHNNTRVPDSLGHWGGEEFIEIIPDISSTLLPSIAERRRILAGNSELPHHGSRPAIRVTVSIGATLIRPGDTQESLLQRVDGLLYQSRHNGRYRMTVE